MKKKTAARAKAKKKTAVKAKPKKKSIKKPVKLSVKRPVKKPARRPAKRPAPKVRVAAAAPKPSIPSPDPLGPLGAHVSTAGGVAMAPPRGDDIGATGMQLFTKTPNQWKEPNVGAAEVAAYRTALAASGQRFACSHDSYLINLASPDATLRDRSLESFTLELQRCNALGLDALVSHPGNFIDDRASGLARNAKGITQALESSPGPTRLCMELTAGQGTVLGSTFEEMASLLELIPSSLQHRLGVCLDTCHIFAAGYDLVRDYDGVWQRFGDVLGFERLGVIHLNDSLGVLGSHKDRHALIGEGAIGEGPFRRLMQDPRLTKVPKMLETPKGDDLVGNDRRMIAKLRRFAEGAPVAIRSPGAVPSGLT